MSEVLRFLNDKGKIKERFLGLVHVTETSAKSLKNAIDEFFVKHGLSITGLRGQGYVGASNMRDEFNGLKTLILNENKNAHYIHYFAYQLQLVVVSAAEEKDSMENFFQILSTFVNIVEASCKRKDSLRELHNEEILNKIETGEIETRRGQNQKISLTRPNDTRWGSHYKILLRLFTMWNTVGEVLLSIHTDGDTSTKRNSAEGLLDKMDSFQFIFIGMFMMKILGMTNTLSKVLQQRYQNIGCALNMINVVKNNLQAYRQDGWDNLLKEAIEFCDEHEINVPNIEDFVHGISRKTLTGEEPMTYFHHFLVDIFLKVIDTVAVEMERHFTDSNTDLLRCIMCLDPSNSFANFHHDRVLHLADLYSDDFSCTNRMELRQELENYISDIRSNEVFYNVSNLRAPAKKMVEKNYHSYCPLVYHLIKLALLLSVGTATVERSFSTMNLAKIDLSNRLGDDTLSDSLLCYFQKEVFMIIDDEVIM